MKKFLTVISIVTIIAVIVLVLSKGNLKSIIIGDNNSKTQNEVAKIPADAPIVLIDAGHGFKDPGCESEYLSSKESDLTLVIAKLLKKELENKKINAILTHDGKSFPKSKEITAKAKKYGISYDAARIEENNIFSAYERVIYANTVNYETPVGLFVSLHVNSIENDGDISQYEIYYYDQSPYADVLNTLSESISARLDNYTKISGLDSNEAYTVTRYSDFPSLLLEMGYATNKNDAKKLNSENWRKDFARTLAEEITNWINE